MGDFYEEPQNGAIDEDLYENPADEQRRPPPAAVQQRVVPRNPNSSSRTLPPQKPTRPVTTVIGDLHSQQSSNGQWDVPLRNTGKLDEARAQHRLSLRNPPTHRPPQQKPPPPQQQQQHQYPTHSASNAPPPGDNPTARDPAAKKSGLPAGITGGFRLPAASFMSANKPQLRKTDISNSAMDKSKQPSPPASNAKPALKGKPPPPVSKPPVAQSKPAPSQTKPSPVTTKPLMSKPPPKAQKPMPSESPSHLRRDNAVPGKIALTVTSPAAPAPQAASAPRTPSSPTPPGGSTMARRFRRNPLKTVDLSHPPPVPTSSKPKLPTEGKSLHAPATPEAPRSPHLSHDPLRLATTAPNKTGNSPLPLRPEEAVAPSAMPPRPSKPAESPTPPRPPKDASAPRPIAAVRKSASFSRRPPDMQHSPPKTNPPPPPPAGGDDSDDFDEVAEDGEDLYEAAMDETLSPQAHRDNADLEDDLDLVLDSIGTLTASLPKKASQPPPPPRDLDAEVVEEIQEDFYDDVEGVAEMLRANQAREAAASQVAAVDDPLYEIEQGSDGLPPPADDLYDDVPCGGGGGGDDMVEEVEEEEEYNEVAAIERSGSFSDIAGDSTDEWSNDEQIDGDPGPLPASTASTAKDGQQPGADGPKRKLSKRTKKRLKDEEKQKQLDEKKAKEDAKRREKEDREAAKQREREARESKKKDAERVKIVEKQRKHHKITAQDTPSSVATAKVAVRKAPAHYLFFNEGERFNVLFSETSKNRKLPKNAWLVERQLDEQVGYVAVANLVTDEVNGDDMIEADCMYEDVGQGSALANAALASPSRLPVSSMPPPSVRAPPVPGTVIEPEEECLYEDLPN